MEQQIPANEIELNQKGKLLVETPNARVFSTQNRREKAKSYRMKLKDVNTTNLENSTGMKLQGIWCYVFYQLLNTFTLNLNLYFLVPGFQDLPSIKSSVGPKSAIWENDDYDTKKRAVLQKIFTHNYASKAEAKERIKSAMDQYKKNRDSAVKDNQSYQLHLKTPKAVSTGLHTSVHIINRSALIHKDRKPKKRLSNIMLKFLK